MAMWLAESSCLMYEFKKVSAAIAFKLVNLIHTQIYLYVHIKMLTFITFQMAG